MNPLGILVGLFPNFYAATFFRTGLFAHEIFDNFPNPFYAFTTSKIRFTIFNVVIIFASEMNEGFFIPVNFGEKTHFNYFSVKNWMRV